MPELYAPAKIRVFMPVRRYAREHRDNGRHGKHFRMRQIPARPLNTNGADMIVGMNDSTVLGGVRATEGQGFKASDIIGIGINGVDAVSELSKAQATGFYGSLLPSPDVHGYKSSEMLYNWVAKGVEPTKFTEVTDVVLITRDNFKEELEKKGLGGK